MGKSIQFWDHDTQRMSIIDGGLTRWFGDTAGIPYGNCYGDHIGWTQAAAAQNTWYNISDASMVSGQLLNVTHDGSGQLTAPTAGRYTVTLDITYCVNAANKHIDIGLEVNSSGTAVASSHLHSETKFANVEEVLSIKTILDLAANDTVEASIRTVDTGTPTIEVEDVHITMIHIGGT